MMGAEKDRGGFLGNLFLMGLGDVVKGNLVKGGRKTFSSTENPSLGRYEF